MAELYLILVTTLRGSVHNQWYE